MTETADKDTYTGYMTETTWQIHVSVSIVTYYHKMEVESLLEIEYYSDKIKSYKLEKTRCKILLGLQFN
jgi:hypothetical protein